MGRESHGDYMQLMDEDKELQSNNGGLIKGIKQFVHKKNNKKQMQMQEIEEEESDSELVNLENEYHPQNESRVSYENNTITNGFNTMILGNGGDDSDDMLL